MSNSREARPKFNRKISREKSCDICETENSSPVTLCDDSAAIADQYKKIVGLIIPPEALKKGRHTNHMCQQGKI